MSKDNLYGSMEKEIRMGMNLVERDEFTETIHTISHIAADTVKKTLGPYAHTTIIDDGNFVYPTKDGWAVLSRIRFQDPTHNSIYNMLKNISARIVDKVGDGTTTAMVVADHFMEQMDEVFGQSSYRQKDIVDTLQKVKTWITKELETRAIQIAPSPNEENPDYQAIYDVAYTSSNGNEQLATIMQEIYQKTKNPNVMVDMAGGSDISYEILSGYRLDCEHLMHERYVNTTERYFNSNHENHLFAIFDHALNYQKDGALIQAILDQADRMQVRPVIMAPYFDDIISSQFAIRVQQYIQKHPNYIPNVIVIQIPEMNNKLQKYYLRDFAALANVPITDATKVKIFNELRYNARVENPEDRIHDSAMDVEGYNFTTAQELLDSCLGMVADFTVGKNFINLASTNFESTYYKERLAEAQADYEEATKVMKNSPTTFVKEYLEASQRLNKLSGALGVIHVGGSTDLERQCTRDVVDDTFRACRSAYENGVVAGLNMGPIVAINYMMENELDDITRDTLCVLRDAYLNTSLDVLYNKGGSYEWRYDNGVAQTVGSAELLITLSKDIAAGKVTGYNIVTEEACTKEIPEIINSVAADIEILNAVVGILGMVLTSDQYLSVNRMYDKSAAIRQQEAMNKISTHNKVSAILESIVDFASKNDMSVFKDLLGGVEVDIDPFSAVPETSLTVKHNDPDKYGTGFADYKFNPKQDS